MSPNSQSTKNEDSDREVEKFLNLWLPLPTENANCPPDYVLVSVARESEESAQKWTEHVKTCLHCTRIIELLRETERPKITLQHIFANASRDAQKVRSKSHSGRETAHSQSWSFGSASLFNAQPRSIMAFAVSLVLIGVVLVGSRQLSFFKSSNRVATVSFERNESKELLQSLEARLAQLQETKVPTEQERQYVAEYNDTIQQIKTLNNQKKIAPEDRGQVAFLSAQYRNRLENQISDNHHTKHYPTGSNVAPIENETDTQAVTSLAANYQAAKKKENGSNASTEVINQETFNDLAREIEFESMNNDTVLINAKIANRSPENTATLLKGMQSYAAQENRKVYLKSDGQIRLVTAANTFAAPNP